MLLAERQVSKPNGASKGAAVHAAVDYQCMSRKCTAEKNLGSCFPPRSGEWARWHQGLIKEPRVMERNAHLRLLLLLPLGG
jgi:hypothetical protein